MAWPYPSLLVQTRLIIRPILKLHYLLTFNTMSPSTLSKYFTTASFCVFPKHSKFRHSIKDALEKHRQIILSQYSISGTYSKNQTYYFRYACIFPFRFRRIYKLLTGCYWSVNEVFSGSEESRIFIIHLPSYSREASKTCNGEANLIL